MTKKEKQLKIAGSVKVVTEALQELSVEFPQEMFTAADIAVKALEMTMGKAKGKGKAKFTREDRIAVSSRVNMAMGAAYIDGLSKSAEKYLPKCSKVGDKVRAQYRWGIGDCYSLLEDAVLCVDTVMENMVDLTGDGGVEFVTSTELALRHLGYIQTASKGVDWDEVKTITTKISQILVSRQRMMCNNLVRSPYPIRRIYSDTSIRKQYGFKLSNVSAEAA